VILCAGILGALWWFSLYLAAARIYQVDECGNVGAAYAVWSGCHKAAVDLFQILLSVALPRTGGTVDFLVSARHVMVVIFWINWLFIALATGERLLSPRWWLALLGAATLAPLWDYGFEVRHDNVLLLGLLIAWSAVRFGPPRLQSFFIVGMITCALQCVAVKALVYTVPLSLGILAFPPPGRKAPRWKLVLAWLTGVLATWIVIRVSLGAFGVWDDFMAGTRGIASASVGADRHRYWWPTLALARFLQETPLIAALALAALAALGIGMWRNAKSVLNWNGILPEALLLGVAFEALLINPTPFLYNLVNLVPFAFLLAFRYAALLSTRIGDRREMIPAGLAILIFAHLAPFCFTTRRHLDWPNTRQENLIQLAEALTDPTKDPVFDAIGMVPTRPFVDDRAFLHTMSFSRSQPVPRMADLLAARPAAVVIPNYRTDWLSPRDKAYIRERYVSVADDFWVLGTVLARGGGNFEVIHPGRYRIAPLRESDLAGTHSDGFDALLKREQQQVFSGGIDGKPLTARPVELTVGNHQIQCASDEQVAVVWVGPILDRLPPMRRGDHTLLFANGY
jgi:hypothetical protein